MQAFLWRETITLSACMASLTPAYLCRGCGRFVHTATSPSYPCVNHGYDGTSTLGMLSHDGLAGLAGCLQSAGHHTNLPNSHHEIWWFISIRPYGVA